MGAKFSTHNNLYMLRLSYLSSKTFSGLNLEDVWLQVLAQIPNPNHISYDYNLHKSLLDANSTLRECKAIVAWKEGTPVGIVVFYNDLIETNEYSWWQLSGMTNMIGWRPLCTDLDVFTHILKQECCCIEDLDPFYTETKSDLDISWGHYKSKTTLLPNYTSDFKTWVSEYLSTLKRKARSNLNRLLKDLTKYDLTVNFYLESIENIENLFDNKLLTHYLNYWDEIDAKDKSIECEEDKSRYKILDDTIVLSRACEMGLLYKLEIVQGDKLIAQNFCIRQADSIVDYLCIRDTTHDCPLGILSILMNMYFCSQHSSKYNLGSGNQKYKDQFCNSDVLQKTFINLNEFSVVSPTFNEWVLPIHYKGELICLEFERQNLIHSVWELPTEDINHINDLRVSCKLPITTNPNYESITIEGLKKNGYL